MKILWFTLSFQPRHATTHPALAKLRRRILGLEWFRGAEEEVPALWRRWQLGCSLPRLSAPSRHFHNMLQTIPTSEKSSVYRVSSECPSDAHCQGGSSDFTEGNYSWDSELCERTRILIAPFSEHHFLVYTHVHYLM